MGDSVMSHELHCFMPTHNTYVETGYDKYLWPEIELIMSLKKWNRKLMVRHAHERGKRKSGNITHCE